MKKIKELKRDVANLQEEVDIKRNYLNDKYNINLPETKKEDPIDSLNINKISKIIRTEENEKRIKSWIDDAYSNRNSSRNLIFNLLLLLIW